MKRWSVTNASPARQIIERLSNVWLTAVQFFSPFGLPETDERKVKLIVTAAGGVTKSYQLFCIKFLLFSVAFNRIKNVIMIA